jgi:hypothetical protein
MSSSIQIQQDKQPAQLKLEPPQTKLPPLPSRPVFTPFSIVSAPVPMNYCYFCIVCTSQSNPSSSPSPLVAQLPRTDHSLPFSPPARPSLSEISAGERAPSTSCSTYTNNLISQRSLLCHKASYNVSPDEGSSSPACWRTRARARSSARPR